MDETSSLGNVPRKTLTQKCYETIKRSILRGDIAPGERLQEVRMANMLNVSPAPVREAFRMLAAEGLIRIAPWKGAVVRRYSPSEVLDVVQCRAALETLALKLAYQNLGEELVARIEEELSLLQDTEDVSSIVYCNANIHKLWVEGSQNAKLIAFVDQLNDVILHGMNFSADDTTRRQEIQAEHRAILRALKVGNVDQAIAALTLHIYNGYYYDISLEEKLEAPVQPE